MRTRNIVVSIIIACLAAAPLTACKKKQPVDESRGSGAGGTSTGGAQGGENVAVNAPGAHVDMQLANGAQGTKKGDAAPAAQPQKTAAPEAPASQCFTVAYTHAEIRAHSDDPEVCANHKNRLKLPQAANPAAICVRVNGVPVKFQAVKPHGTKTKGAPVAAVVIDPIIAGGNGQGGAKAKVTVRYCLGKIRCLEECSVPKDDFMGAIGGDVEAENSKHAAKWDSEEGDDVDVLGQIDSGLQAELDGDADLAMFEGWTADEGQPSCLNAQKSDDSAKKRAGGRKTASLSRRK